jgi:hypothetical protein
MHICYRVEKCREQWAIYVNGVVFFRFKNRREAILTARLASEMLHIAAEDDNSSPIGDRPSRGEKEGTVPSRGAGLTCRRPSQPEDIARASNRLTTERSGLAH